MNPGWRVHPVQQEQLLHRLPRHLRAPRRPAHEDGDRQGGGAGGHQHHCEQRNSIKYCTLFQIVITTKLSGEENRILRPAYSRRQRRKTKVGRCISAGHHNAELEEVSEPKEGDHGAAPLADSVQGAHELLTPGEKKSS